MLSAFVIAVALISTPGEAENFGPGAPMTRDFEGCVYYTSTNVPLTIIDDGGTVTISELTIAESFLITDINVLVDIDHLWDDDLDIFIESPTGTLVELSTDLGGSDNDYSLTTFDDQALDAITAGTAPFTGCFRPEGLLSDLIGEDAQGTWKLRVTDDFTGQPGTLQGWQLQFDCYCGDLGDGEYPSGDVPLAIPDDATNAVISFLSVLDSVSIADVNVMVDITHTWDEDLDVTLESPEGTIVELFTDVGGNGNDFDQTLLDDEAGTSITAGSAPFAGTFFPEGLLSAFDGEDAQGDWVLTVFDDDVLESGTLNGWSLFITPGGPEISVEPVSWDFGYQSTAAGASTVKSIVVTNEGTDNLSISGSALVGGDSGHFVIESGGGAAVLGPLGTHTVQVSFDPSSTGSKAVLLRISSNDTDEPTVDVTLSGEGFDPALGVSGEVWVDFSHSGTEEGTLALPFDSVSEGMDFVQPGGMLHLSAGTTSETLTLSKQVSIDALGGTVRIGD